MSRIDVPIVDEGDPDLRAVHEALEDPQKRWLVAGICIHTVISPRLREFVKPVFEGIYTALVRDEFIDAQTYKPNVTNYPLNGGKKLNYECINNNKAIVGLDRQKRFDYAVRSAVDLSKLFLQTHMCFHTGFDNSCDSSALLTFLINVDDFNSVHRTHAQRFKNEIRNDWAHCDFRVWTEQKLADSFDLMQDFICSLQLPRDDETKVLNELRDWKTNGQSFLSGSTLGLELVMSLMNHTQKLQTYIRTLAEQTKDEFKEVSATFETINESLLTFEQKFKEIERTLLRHEEDIGRLQERVSSNKNCLRSFDTRITNIEKNTSSTAKNSGKRLFQVPHRTEFVGRVDILKQVEDALIGPSVETNKLVLCGLGGIGKTSIAVEYIWNHHAVHYPGGVFWISGESYEAFENSIRCLAAVIGTLGQDQFTTRTLTWNWISLRQGRCLVVIDNVDEDQISNPVIRLVKEHNEVIGTYNHLVITTRRSMVKASDELSCVKCIPVDVMSESESTAFFKSKLGDTKDSDDDIVALCVEIQGLPLAIEQAATTIRQLKWTVSGYLREFKKRRTELFSKPLSSNVSHIDDFNKHSILTTWSLNIENIKKKANNEGLTEAIDLLLPLVARLARDDITTDMFNRGDPRLPNDQVADTFESEYRKLKVVYLFTEYSILTENSDQTFRIHSLVQDVIRECFKDPVRDLSYVGKCAISMLNMARDLAFKQEDTVLLAKIKKQCAALKMHFENSEDVYLDLITLEIRCQTLTYNITSRERVATGFDSIRKSIGEPKVEAMTEECFQKPNFPQPLVEAMTEECFQKPNFPQPLDSGLTGHKIFTSILDNSESDLSTDEFCSLDVSIGESSKSDLPMDREMTEKYFQKPNFPQSSESVSIEDVSIGERSESDLPMDSGLTGHKIFTSILDDSESDLSTDDFCSLDVSIGESSESDLPMELESVEDDLAEDNSESDLSIDEFCLLDVSIGESSKSDLPMERIAKTKQKQSVRKSHLFRDSKSRRNYFKLECFEEVDKSTVRGATGYQPYREVSYRLFREEIPEQMVDDSFCQGKAPLFTQVASFGVRSMKGIGSFFNTPNVRRQNIIGYASFLGINAVAVMVYNILFRK